MTTIPASEIVQVTPGVVTGGGNALDLIGLALTNGARVPVGQVLSFPTSTAVQTYFGVGSAEAAAAAVYFLGFDNSNKKPGAMLFAQYNSAAVGAYLRGGNISGLTLTQLQAISGTLTVVMDGNTYTGSPNLSSASSFSAAATLIQTALNTSTPSEMTATASIATTTMTVTALLTGTIIPGQVLSGTSVTTNTKVTVQLTSTETDGHLGGKGTYTVDTSQTTASTTITGKGVVVVTYDSVSGAFQISNGTSGPFSTIAYATGAAAVPLLLTAATGAVLSQGAAAATPATVMAAVTAQTQDWATFFTTFNPDNSGNANKLLFAAWTNSQNDRFLYAAWDTDITATQSNDASASLGQLLEASNYSGTSPIYEPTDMHDAAFLCGAIASIDFDETNGRATLAFKSQTGLTPGVTDATSAANLIANNYNYYGAYATAAQGFNFLYPGSVSGPYLWIDSYINQIWLNNAFQLALMELLTNAKSIPYNPSGYAQIAAACQDPINAALNFGAIRAGVPLSSQQASLINSSAGKSISNTIQTQGWYLQIQPATSQVRAARQSPPITFWYQDGESVQQINLASIIIQ